MSARAASRNVSNSGTKWPVVCLDMKQRQTTICYELEWGRVVINIHKSGVNPYLTLGNFISSNFFFHFLSVDWMSVYSCKCVCVCFIPGVKSSSRLNVILWSPCQRGPTVIACASVREPVQGEKVLLRHSVNSTWPLSSLLDVGLWTWMFNVRRNLLVGGHSNYCLPFLNGT